MNVGQRLLQDAVGSQVHRVRQRMTLPVHSNLDLDSRCAGRVHQFIELRKGRVRRRRGPDCVLSGGERGVAGITKDPDQLT